MGAALGMPEPDMGSARPAPPTYVKDGNKVRIEIPILEEEKACDALQDTLRLMSHMNSVGGGTTELVNGVNGQIGSTYVYKKTSIHNTGHGSHRGVRQSVTVITTTLQELSRNKATFSQHTMIDMKSSHQNTKITIGDKRDAMGNVLVVMESEMSPQDMTCFYIMMGIASFPFCFITVPCVMTCVKKAIDIAMKTIALSMQTYFNTYLPGNNAVAPAVQQPMAVAPAAVAAAPAVVAPAPVTDYSTPSTAVEEEYVPTNPLVKRF